METPTGVLLGEFTPGTPEWDAARAGLCITATEIAAVMGLSPWQSPFSLWHKKAGLPNPPFESNPAVEWGNRLEDAVAQKIADNHPELTLARTGTWRHVDREWQRATPDRLAGRIVECKTSPFGDDWGPDGTDQVPIHYRCQVIWQQDTLGLFEPAIVGVLIGGWDYRELFIEYDAMDAEIMRGAAERFLASVRRNERPPIDGSDATYQTIRVQPNGREDVDVEIPFGTVCRWDAAYEAHQTASAELTAVRSEVLDLIGNGYRAVCEDRRIAYRTVNPDGTTHALQPYRSHS